MDLKLNLFKSDAYIFMQQSLLNSVNFREHDPLSFQFPVNVQNNLENQWPAFLMDLLPQGYGRKEFLNQLGFSINAEEQADWTPTEIWGR